MDSQHQASDADNSPSMNRGPTTPAAPAAGAPSPLKSPSRLKAGSKVMVTVDKMGFKDDRQREEFVDPIITVYIVCA